MYTKEQVLAKVRVLCETLRESEPYVALFKAKQELGEHTAAKIMLDDFRAKQRELYQKQLSQEEFKAGLEELRKLYEIISYNPYVRDFLTADAEFQQLLLEIHQAIGEAIAPLAPEMEEGATAKEKEKEAKTAEG